MWTDHYAPESLTELVGNEGAINQIFEWLRDWDDVNIRGKKKVIKSGFKKNWLDVPRINAKAAMVSGPPGIGKSSAVRIICKTLGYQCLELNASDTRSKMNVQGFIGALSENQSLDYWTDRAINLKQQSSGNELLESIGGFNTQKSVIVMDEVDGCGASDRGGIPALIQVIKTTKTPIICICNDRQNRKLQTLISYCYDLKFIRPQPEDIIERLSNIAKNE
jgi:replication factor C subunit 1